MEFCDKVKSVRKQLGLTQATFAKELGIARATLIRWGNGEFKPNYDAQRRFEEFCKNRKEELTRRVCFERKK